MGSPADLTLGCRAQPSGNVFKAVAANGDQIETFRKLDEFLKALEDERRKIEAFKRELPHCMQLLDFAIEVSKDRLEESPRSPSRGHGAKSYGEIETSTLGSFGKHVVEEYLKKSWEVPKREVEEVEKVSRREADHRPSWMAEAQLWSQPSRSDAWKEKESSTEDSARLHRDATESTVTSPANIFNSHKRGGAFLPFIKEKPVPSIASRVNVGAGAELALSSVESRPNPHIGLRALECEVGSLDVSTTGTRDVQMDIVQGKDNGQKMDGSASNGNNSGGTGSTSSGGGNGGGGGGGQAQRKARRCWSPELHRRFVSALQQLGGSQIATPKQIRELMKVDGLTNDEVKSHLQKYRLHTRRPSPAPQAPQQQTPQLVVLGGIWVPPEYTSSGMYHDPPSSVSQQGHFCQASLPQELYSQLNPSAQIQLHRSQSHSSPQGTLQSNSQLSSGARQTSGEMYIDDSTGEDGKSESSSWKGDDDSGGRRSEKESDREGGSSGRDDDEEDTDAEDEGRESGMRLKLEMSFSRSHTAMKPEPQMV